MPETLSRLCDNFSDITNYAEDTITDLREINTLFRKLQSVESDYAKALSKVSDAVKRKDRSTPLSPVKTNLLQFFDDLGAMQQAYLKDITEKVFDPLQDFLRDQEKVKKGLTAEGQAEIKQLQEIATTLAKAKDQYTSLQKTADDAEKAFQKTQSNYQSKEKDRVKSKSKLDAATEKANEAKTRVDGFETTHRTAQSLFYSKRMPHVLNRIELSLENQYQNVRQLVKEYVDSSLRGHERVMQATAPVPDFFESSTTETVRSFASQFGGAKTVVSASSLLNPAYRGRLKLRKGGQPGDTRDIGGWKEYFFVLMPPGDDPSCLMYYFDQEHSQMQEGILRISKGEAIVRTLDASMFARDRCFQVHTSEGFTAYLYARQQEEYDTWKHALDSVTKPDMSAQCHTIRSVTVDVREAKDLQKSGDYYCAIVLKGEENAVPVTPYLELQAMTGYQYDSDAPMWTESFSLDDIPSCITGVCVRVYMRYKVMMPSLFSSGTGSSAHGYGKGKKTKDDSFVGEATIPISDVQATPKFEKWLPLHGSAGTQTGSIRLRLAFAEETVRPLADYSHLIAALTRDPTVFSVCDALGSNKDRMVATLVNILRAHSPAAAMSTVAKLINREIAIAADEATLLRHNSVPLKAAEKYMRIMAREYLRKTLGPVLEEIYDKRVNLEVDPSRLPEGEDMRKRKKLFLHHVTHLWNTIQHSAASVPKEVLQLLSEIRTAATKKFGNDSTCPHTAVGGLFFLRFLCPALLAPKSFGLMPSHPPEQIGRTLTLLTKTIQNLANLVEFGSKEEYMKDMNEFLQEHFGAMREFMVTISTAPGQYQPRTGGSVDLPREASVAENLLREEFDAVRQAATTTTGLQDVVAALDALQPLDGVPASSPAATATSPAASTRPKQAPPPLPTSAPPSTPAPALPSTPPPRTPAKPTPEGCGPIAEHTQASSSPTAAAAASVAAIAAGKTSPRGPRKPSYSTGARPQLPRAAPPPPLKKSASQELGADCPSSPYAQRTNVDTIPEDPVPRSAVPPLSPRSFIRQRERSRAFSEDTPTPHTAAAEASPVTATPAAASQTPSDTHDAATSAQSDVISGSDYVWDEASKYYYSASTGYYYDPKTKLYYYSQTGKYYYLDEAKNEMIPYQ
eukprot:Rmarinus@m.738